MRIREVVFTVWGVSVFAVAKIFYIIGILIAIPGMLICWLGLTLLESPHWGGILRVSNEEFVRSMKRIPGWLKI